jgi:Xaa-Pro aminopeptidase
MKQPVKEAGYLLKPPLGHVCGVDLMEAQVSQQNELLLEAGMTVIIHPTVLTVDGKRSFFLGRNLFSRSGWI